MMRCWICGAPMTDSHTIRSYDGILRVEPNEWNHGRPINGVPHTCALRPPSPEELARRGRACLDAILQAGLEAVMDMATSEPVKKKHWMGWY